MKDYQYLEEELFARWAAEMQRLPLPACADVAGGEAGEKMRRIVHGILVVAGSDGEETDGEELLKAARELGSIRKNQDFSIEELVQEHIILRNEFWTLFREKVELGKVVDFALERRVNGCLDLAMQAAAAAYHYEVSREISENPLRDNLTRLYNRSYFQGRLIEELRRAVRYEREISLCLMEITNYSQIRQAGGQEAVERLLCYVGSVLSRLTRECDVTARLGEGNFAVLLPETGWRGARVMAERLTRYLERFLPSLVEGEVMPEIRWGVASFPGEVRMPERLYNAAAEALRRSREAPPGSIFVHGSPEGGKGGH
jgi:diguanylate cyclase (GGDEF)-like protein